MQTNSAQKIANKQKLIYASLIGLCLVVGLTLAFLPSEDNTPPTNTSSPTTFDTPSTEINPEEIRLSQLENISDLLSDRLLSLEKSLVDLKEEKGLLEQEKHILAEETAALKEQLKSVEENVILSSTPSHSSLPSENHLSGFNGEKLKAWEPLEKTNERHTLFEIPAGTVVKAILVSGADCSVAIQKPTGPNMVLLRPLDNGKLPRNVRVLLKGSVIIGNAIGDIASERVYVRAERMTLVERNGSFIETELSAYVSGEDGREGLRGVVVDRSGQIITRAAFASFLQGIGQTVEGVLNNQSIEKLAKTSANASILNLDMFRTSAMQGGTTALGKMADYYIKRAEQLQPTIQIAAGRVVDVIFTKTIKIGEKDLKKKLEKEREAKFMEKMHG